MVAQARNHHMITGMLSYSLYTLFAVGLAVLLTATFRRLRRDEHRVAPREENAAFDRRIAAIEGDYGLEQKDGTGRKPEGADT